MVITARFASTCPLCHQSIQVGASVNWERGSKASHVKCPTAKAAAPKAAPKHLVALAPGGAQSPTGRTNRKPANCDTCGHFLAVGQGSLHYCVEDSGCMQHHNHDGWHVYCLDVEACKTRTTERRAAAKAAAEEAARKAAEKKAAQEAAAAAYRAAKDAIPTDYLRTESVLFPALENAEVVAEMDDFYRCRLSRGTIGGEVAYVETATGYDDYRTTLIAPTSVVLPLLDATIAARNITREAAEQWLAQCKGCAGTELYERALVPLAA